MAIDVEVAEIMRARHGVVGERTGQDLPRIPVVNHLLHQYFARRLGDTAMDLPVDQQRIELHPGVVHGGVADDLCNTGLGIDLDLADMAAVRDV